MKLLKSTFLWLLALLCVGCAQASNPMPVSPSPQAHTQSPKPASPSPQSLQEAPKLEVVDQDGQTLKLAELYASHIVLVYFYPKADTPGCTAQACSLRDSYADLSDIGVKVLGVSLDDPATQKAFKKKHQLPFTLVSDQDGKLADAFRVPHAGGFASRQAFLIDKGTVIWHDATASTAKQAEDVLAQLKTLKR